MFPNSLSGIPGLTPQSFANQQQPLNRTNVTPGLQQTGQVAGLQIPGLSSGIDPSLLGLTQTGLAGLQQQSPFVQNQAGIIGLAGLNTGLPGANPLSSQLAGGNPLQFLANNSIAPLTFLQTIQGMIGNVMAVNPNPPIQSPLSVDPLAAALGMGGAQLGQQFGIPGVTPQQVAQTPQQMIQELFRALAQVSPESPEALAIQGRINQLTQSLTPQEKVQVQQAQIMTQIQQLDTVTASLMNILPNLPAESPQAQMLMQRIQALQNAKGALAQQASSLTSQLGSQPTVPGAGVDPLTGLPVSGGGTTSVDPLTGLPTQPLPISLPNIPGLPGQNPGTGQLPGANDINTKIMNGSLTQPEAMQAANEILMNLANSPTAGPGTPEFQAAQTRLAALKPFLGPDADVVIQKGTLNATLQQLERQGQQIQQLVNQLGPDHPAVQAQVSLLQSLEASKASIQQVLAQLG